MHWLSSFGLGAYNPFQNYVSPHPTVNNTVKTSSLASASAQTDGLPSLEEIKHYSLKAFDCFKKNWDFDNFWKRANTCDACVRFAEVFLSHYPNDPESSQISVFIQEMLEKNLKYYRASKLEDKWLDDFGWWGIMALNAYQLLTKLKNDKLAKEYFELAHDCWSYMIKHGYDHSPNATPIPHGCKNNSVDTPDQGVKNTIVNALLLMQSARLYKLSAQAGVNQEDRTPYLDMALNQWQWFSKWFERKEDGYIKIFQDNAWLVCERPLAKNSDYQDISHPNWTDGWIWTGDQGILIGGLLDLYNLKHELPQSVNSNFEAEVKEVIRKLVLGIQGAVIGNHDKMFHEPPCLSSYFNYASEYLGGRGVLVRYIGVTEIAKLFDIDISQNILKTVQVIWSSRDETTNQFKAEFINDIQSQEYFTQFRILLGYADSVNYWQLDTSDIKYTLTAPQAVGLDFLGAALSLYKDKK